MVQSRQSTLAALCLLLALATSVAAENTKSFQVQVTGTGRPILLIPGLASSGDTWTTTVAHLGGRFTCHVLTLAGFAGTAPIDGYKRDSRWWSPCVRIVVTPLDPENLDRRAA